MCGAECGAGACNALCLNAYSWTMALALLGQTALAVAVFVVPTGYLRAPNDITGAESRAWRLIHKNLVVVKWFAIALLVLQVTSVSAAMILKRIAQAKRRRRDSRLEHDDEYDSSEDEYEWEDESSSYYSRRGRVGTRTRRPLLFPFLRGGVDTGETPSNGAIREALEETGWRPTADPTPIIVFHPSNGLSDQTFHIFHCAGAEHVGDPTDLTEASRVEWRPVHDVVESIRAGDITDGLSLTALTSAITLGILHVQS